jgi:glucose/mannose-6-phosphate isomerase
LDLNILQKYDKRKMYEVYDKWPAISENAYNYEHAQIKFTEINHIVFAGMGGSGTIGDIFAAIFSKTNIHVSVIKGYLLPNTVDSNSLVVTTSISGNTVETLNIIKLAKEKNCKIIAISSGGKMEEYCKNNNIDFRKVTQFHSPRASFTGFLYSLLKILKPILPIKENQINESLSELKKMRTKICSENLSDSNPALNLAEWITGIPLIYYPHGLNASAVRFKNSLQENAKLHAIAEDVIESCHNGIIAWENQSNVQPILLQGEDDFIKTKERYKIIKELFQEKNINYKEIHSLKGNILTKLICLIYLLDYCSIYRAINFKMDPSPIDSIDYIKKRL